MGEGFQWVRGFSVEGFQWRRGFSGGGERGFSGEEL